MRRVAAYCSFHSNNLQPKHVAHAWVVDCVIPEIVADVQMKIFRDIALTLPFALPASIALYIIAGTKGQTWVASAVNTGSATAFINNLSLYVLISIYREWKLIWINAGLSITLLFVSAFGVISSFPGTGERFGNHGSDLITWLGLINYFLIASLATRSIWKPIAGITLCFPVISAIAYLIYVLPLSQELFAADFSKTCYFVTENPYQPLDKGQRIRSYSEAPIRFMLSESAPRFFRVSNNGIETWSYTKVGFSSTRWKNTLSANCTSILN